jgi:catechol 2,3-dioxygenase
LAELRRRIETAGGRLVDPPNDASGDGIWFRDPCGVLIQVAVRDKVSPASKSETVYRSSPAMTRGAMYRDEVQTVRPRRMSHALIFMPDVLGAIDFYGRALGVRLSDHSGDGIAFMHGIHGSDHHMIAFAKSSRIGYHHSSWDVASVEEVGLGAMQMSEAGFRHGWGLGRHVLGSNYFHYIQDPWGSFAEYSADIDYIPARQIWDAKDHDAANSFYLWGPAVPSDFVVNTDGES